MHAHIQTYFMCVYVVHYPYHADHDSKKKGSEDDKLGDHHYSVVKLHQIETSIEVYACVE